MHKTDAQGHGRYILKGISIMSSIGKHVLVWSLVLVAVLAAAAFFFLASEFQSERNATPQEEGITVQENLAAEGTLSLTLRRPPGREFNVYTYDVATDEIAVTAPELGPSHLRITGAFDRNRERFAHFGTPVVPDAPLSFDAQRSHYVLVSFPVEDAAQWRTWEVGEHFINSHPSWSPDGAHIAYEALTAGRGYTSGEWNNLDNWQVEVSSAEGGEVQRLDSGVLPHWLPQDENLVLYVKSSGVYAYDIARATSTMLRAFDGEVNKGVSFDVSHNGEYVALLENPEQIDVYRLTLAPPALEHVHRIAAPEQHRYLGVVISPDGQFVAFINEDASEDMFTWPEVRLVLYSLEQQAMRVMHTFGDTFLAQPVMMSQWVE